MTVEQGEATGGEVRSWNGRTYLSEAELARIFSVEEFETLAKERLLPSNYGYIAGWAGTGAAHAREPRCVLAPRPAAARARRRPHRRPQHDRPRPAHRPARPVRAVGLPAAVAPRRRAGGGPRVAPRRHDDGPQHELQLLARGGRRDRARPVVPALLVHRRGRDARHDRARRGRRATRRSCSRWTRRPGSGAKARCATRSKCRTGSSPANVPDRPLTIASNLTWRSLEWLRGISPGMKLVLKGILTAEDAQARGRPRRRRGDRVEPRRTNARLGDPVARRAARGGRRGRRPDRGLPRRRRPARQRRDEGAGAGGARRPARPCHPVGTRDRRRGGRRPLPGAGPRRARSRSSGCAARRRIDEINRSMVARLGEEVA